MKTLIEYVIVWTITITLIMATVLMVYGMCISNLFR
jgi:hypothetical protein